MFWRRKQKPPEEPIEGLLKRALKLLKRERYEAGIALLERVLEREPANLVAHVNLGSTYYLLHRLEEAQRHFQHVLGLDPNHATALLNLAAVYNEMGDLDRSLELLEQVLKAYPHHPDCHYNLAVAYLKKGDRNRAIEELKKELEINPKSSHARPLLRELETEAD